MPEAGGANDPFNQCSAMSHDVVPLSTALHSIQTIYKHKHRYMINPIKPVTFWIFYQRGEGGRSAPKLSPELMEELTSSKRA